MARSARSAVALAALVALAGCAALGVGSGSPTPATATPQWPATMPPGVTTEGVEEPLALARAHTSALVGGSFAYRSTLEASTVDGVPLGTVTTVHRVDADGRFVHASRVEGVVPPSYGRLRAVDAYSNGTVTVVRFRTDGRNRTLVSSADEAALSAYGVVGKGTLYSLVAATDPTVRGTLRRGGTTYLHLKGDNGTVRLGVTEATNASFEALVAPSGLVQRYALAYHANVSSDAGWEGRLVRTTVYDDLGETTVERPDWVAEALPNATEVPPGR